MQIVFCSSLWKPWRPPLPGIILSTATKEKPVVSEVVAVGPGGVVDGNEVKMVVKPGDKVVVAKYAGTEVKVEDVEYSIVRQSEILAIVE